MPDIVPGSLLKFLFDTPRQPFEWDIFISLLQMRKLSPREGKSFESGHTAGERKSQNWNLHSLSPESLLFLSTPQAPLWDFVGVYGEDQGELSAWLRGDRDLRVSKSFLNFGVNPNFT